MNRATTRRAICIVPNKRTFFKFKRAAIVSINSATNTIMRIRGTCTCTFIALEFTVFKFYFFNAIQSNSTATGIAAILIICGVVNKITIRKCCRSTCKSTVNANFKFNSSTAFLL